MLSLLWERFSAIQMTWADGGCAVRLISWAAKALRLNVAIVKHCDDVRGFPALGALPSPRWARRSRGWWRSPAPDITSVRGPQPGAREAWESGEVRIMASPLVMP